MPENGNFEGLLDSGLGELGLSESAAGSIAYNKISALLEKYIAEIEAFNNAYGLVKVSGREELIVRHILDSITPLGIIRQFINDLVQERVGSADSSMAPGGNIKIVDVGSGAGLPGIPLAVCLPDIEFTLMERMGRRVGFLHNCIAVLGMRNLKIEEIDMEKAEPGRFDIAVFRAFRPLTPDILKGLFRLLKPGGFLAAWKGRFEKAEEEMLAVKRVFPEIKWEIMPVVVPFLEDERHLTVIRAL